MSRILNELIKDYESKPVKERTNKEHLFLIKHKHNMNVRDYLLSMGDFKDDASVEKSETENKQ